MSLISPSYFQEPIDIGQIELPEVAAAVNVDIQKYEPDFLKKLMGYSMYKAFNIDLATIPIPARTVNLLYGAEFTNLTTGQLDYFDGLIPNAQLIGVTTYIPGDIEIVITGDLIGATEYHNHVLAGKLLGVDYRVVQTSYGPLGNTITQLSDGFGRVIPFAANDTYFIQFITPLPLPIPPPSTSPALQSPIANYVYYWYQKSQLTSTTGTGQVKTDNQNSQPATVKYKAAGAWNAMAHWSQKFFDFIKANSEIYPEFDWYSLCQQSRGIPAVYQTINTFGI